MRVCTYVSVFACVQVCIRRAVYMNCLFCLYINWIKNWIKIHVGVCICFSVCVSASMYKRGCVVSPLFTVSKISICICMDRGGRGWSTESGQAWTKGGGGGGGSKKKNCADILYEWLLTRKFSLGIFKRKFCLMVFIRQFCFVLF